MDENKESISSQEKPDSAEQEDSNTVQTFTESPPVICRRCGAEMAKNQPFCHKCGAPRESSNFCQNCGSELQPGQEFCPKCGQKAIPELTATKTGVGSVSEKKKKTLIAVIVAAAVVVAIAAGLIILPKIMIDSAGYIERGDLDKAWSKAKNAGEKQNVIDAALAKGDYPWVYQRAETSEEKQMAIDAALAKGDYLWAYESAETEDERFLIKIENITAVQSAFSAENLKDPSSFSLRDAYYSEENAPTAGFSAQITLYISGANSYGAKVSNYWLYTWDEEDKSWTFWTSVADLTDEEYKSYDSDDDKLEKLVDNIGRMRIRDLMSGGTKLGKDAVERINAMYAEGKLGSVTALDMMINQK